MRKLTAPLKERQCRQKDGFLCVKLNRGIAIPPGCDEEGQVAIKGQARVVGSEWPVERANIEKPERTNTLGRRTHITKFRVLLLKFLYLRCVLNSICFVHSCDVLLSITRSYGVHESKDEYCIAQKDTQPSQTCSGGFIKTQLYAICCCFFAIGEYILI